MKKIFALSLLLPLSAHAMDVGHELVQAAQIGLGGAAVAYAYSRGAEQLSHSIAPRATHDYNVQITCGNPYGIHSGLSKWGAIGSWWMGLPLIAAARLGSHRMESQELIKPAAITYAGTLAASLVVGGFTYATTTNKQEAVIRATKTAAVVGTLMAPVGLIGHILYKRING